jgi:hypothetical protein
MNSGPQKQSAKENAPLRFNKLSEVFLRQQFCMNNLPQMTRQVAHPFPSQPSELSQKWQRTLGEGRTGQRYARTIMRLDETIRLYGDVLKGLDRVEPKEVA